MNLKDKPVSEAPSPIWYVYFIRSASGTLYAGITTDLQRRLQEHRGEVPGGAKYLRGKGPLEMVWSESVADRSEASRLESRLKKLNKSHKERLVAGQCGLAALLDDK